MISNFLSNMLFKVGLTIKIRNYRFSRVSAKIRLLKFHVNPHFHVVVSGRPKNHTILLTS